MQSGVDILSRQLNSPLEKIQDSLLEEKEIELYIKRDDMIHPEISGNKWRKMKYNVIEARQSGFDKILTFGGAYSNHIYAAAASGKAFGLQTIGVIRGEETLPLNPTLNFAKSAGMELKHVSRSEYRNKHTDEFVSKLREEFGDFYLVPEGGSNAFALPGVKELVDEIDVDFDIICAACGTGGTVAGICAGLKTGQKAWGFPALKGGSFIYNEVDRLLKEAKLPSSGNLELFTEFHFGGYAKYKVELIEFINAFKVKHGIPLDPVYTGKMMFGLYENIKKDMLPKGSVVVAVHTGGLQGIDGFNERYGALIE
ncbi:1-aminocyclopropane-1-carboxylate deaminase [Aureibacter tunicatorum]|nr:1-aminocyclopropane-1-carboxylate deaminase [Aureibacter tunicatorum]